MSLNKDKNMLEKLTCF